MRKGTRTEDLLGPVRLEKEENGRVRVGGGPGFQQLLGSFPAPWPWAEEPGLAEPPFAHL